MWIEGDIYKSRANNKYSYIGIDFVLFIIPVNFLQLSFSCTKKNTYIFLFGLINLKKMWRSLLITYLKSHTLKLRLILFTDSHPRSSVDKILNGVDSISLRDSEYDVYLSRKVTLNFEFLISKLFVLQSLFFINGNLGLRQMYVLVLLNEISRRRNLTQRKAAPNLAKHWKKYKMLERCSITW